MKNRSKMKEEIGKRPEKENEEEEVETKRNRTGMKKKQTARSSKK
jgi:hypothetical protein